MTPERMTRAEAKAHTREALLDAGLAMLAEHPAGGTLDHLRALPVAARAGVTHGAFFFHFDSQESFREAVLQERVLASETWGQEREVVADSFDHGKDFLDGVRRAGLADFQFLNTHASWQILVGLWAQRREEWDRRLREHYEQSTEDLAGLYEPLLEAHGLIPRPPLTTRDLAVVAGGLVEGLAIRSVLNPEDFAPIADDDGGEWNLASIALAALLASLVCPAEQADQNFFEAAKAALGVPRAASAPEAEAPSEA